MPKPLDLLPDLLNGLSVTLILTAGGATLAIAMSILGGLARICPHPALRWPAIAYIEVFRGTSALVQLFWFFYALPLFGVYLSPMIAGILVLGLNVGSYGAEVVRGAVQAIDKGQHEAAQALSLSPLQKMRHVILPQAFVRALPPAGNLLIELLKSTALVSLITLNDLTFQAMLMRSESLRTAEIFGLLLLMYFAIAQLLMVATRKLEVALTRGWYEGGAS